MDFHKMIKQAQQIQKKREAAQEELSSQQIEGSASQGAVTVKVNGKNQFISIKLKPEAINPENPSSVDADTLETLEDLITSAMKDANAKADALAQERMGAVTGGIKIPGLM